MKRKILAALLALSVLLAFVPSGSAAGIFFVAMNDTVPLTLSTDVAPYYVGNTFVVPHTAFAVSGLGLTASYQTESGTMTLSGRNQRLVFDLASGKATDEKGTQRTVAVTQKNGVVFLPLGLCMAHFGLTASYLTSAGGYKVLRITNGNQVYDNSLFIQKAENLISYRVDQFLHAQSGAVEEPPAQQEPEDTEENPITVYLAVTGADNMPNALRALSGRNVTAVFFLTAREISENPELVVSIRAAGYPVGLTVEEGETQVTESLNSANLALDRVLHSKTLLALLTKEQSEQAPGYFAMRREYGVSAKTAITREGRSSLVICGQNCSSAVATLRGAQAKFRQLRETSPF